MFVSTVTDQSRKFVFGCVETYRYGFNGKENDPESGTQDYGLRIYNPDLGKFLSVDPLSDEYSYYTPYQFAGNEPIAAVDLDGAEPAYLKPNGGYVTARDGALQRPLSAQGNAYFNEKSNGIVAGGTGVKEVASFLPVVGDVMDVNDAYDDFKAGNYGFAALSVISLIPGADFVTKPVKIALKHADEVKDVAKAITKTEKKLDGLCFVKGTVILTDKGFKVIERIAIGDSVWSFSDNTYQLKKQRVYNTVVRQTSKIIVVKIDSTSIETTPDHPFFVNYKWVEAKNLQAGDSLMFYGGAKGIVHSVKQRDTICEVYNFAVENFHTYYVSNLSVLVHNNNPCSAPVNKPKSTTGKYTEPTLPDKKIVDENGITVEHYYRSGDHAPPHMHVKGGGAETKVGANGKPVKGSPELSSKQKEVVDANKSKIRSAGNKIKAYQNYQNRLKNQ